MPTTPFFDFSRLQSLAGVHTDQFVHEALRLRTQLEFAVGLCELHPRQAGAWRGRIAAAAEAAEAAVALGDLEQLRARMPQIEGLLAPLAKVAKTYTVWCAGHAHIDMNWMWSWPETVAVVNDTFRTVLQLMDEFPEFHFTQSQAACYRIVEQHNPALLARIAARVREGRWEVAASHWVEGDKNIAGSESLCRHLLYTRQYLQELFGLKPEDVAIDWSPDTFGHAATIPTYLAQGGVKYYYGHRFGNVVARRPQVFQWRAPDGATVLVRNDCQNGYNGMINAVLGEKLLVYARESGLREMLFVYGVGDHGGGPTRRDLLYARELNTWPVFPQVRLSTTRPFFQMLEKHRAKLPLLEGELNFEFTGCYTSQSAIKKANRLAENQLGAAEAAAALAWVALGADYPAAGLEEGWRDTLFSHFHDILPGSGVHDTRTYTLGLFQKTAAMTGIVETEALRRLAAAVDTTGVAADAKRVPPSALYTGHGAGVGFGSGHGLPSQADGTAGEGAKPYLLVNLGTRPREGVAMATVWDSAPRLASGGGNPAEAAMRSRSYAVVTPGGAHIPAQVVDGGSYWGHAYATVAFPLEAPLPGLGYGLYTVIEKRLPAAKPGVTVTGLQAVCSYSPPERDELGLENGLVRIDLDGRTGGLRSLRDQMSGRELLDAAQPACVLEYAVERPHVMTAWLLAETGPVSGFRVVSVERRLQGPHVGQIEVQLARGDNTFAVRYELRAGDPCVHVSVTGTWVERGSRETGVPVLRLVMPFALRGARGRYEIPFGAIDRAEHGGEEVPALRWAQIDGTLAGGKAGGCVVANDCKYGHSLDGSTLRVTLLRSSWDPDPIPEVNQHAMKFVLRPFGGTLPVAEAVRVGEALAQPLRAIGTDVHAGRLPDTAALMTVGPAHVVLAGLKRAEDGSGLVARLYDTSGKRSTARIEVHALLGKPVRAQETDLLERPLAASTATVRGQAVTVALPAHGLATVKIALKRR